jgi:hypothetical protein
MHTKKPLSSIINFSLLFANLRLSGHSTFLSFLFCSTSSLPELHLQPRNKNFLADSWQHEPKLCSYYWSIYILEQTEICHLVSGLSKQEGYSITVPNDIWQLWVHKVRNEKKITKFKLGINIPLKGEGWSSTSISRALA